MVSIALVDARKTSLTGVQNSTKKIGSPLRGSWTMVSIALVDAFYGMSGKYINSWRAFKLRFTIKVKYAFCNLSATIVSYTNRR